jgi:hypothetical protein
VHENLINKPVSPSLKSDPSLKRNRNGLPQRAALFKL